MKEHEACTIMQSVPGDPPVERVQISEHFSSEEDATHLYQPKGMEYATSMQPRYPVALVQTEHIRNLQRVLFNSEADKQMRRNALKQLTINVTQRDCEESAVVLQQWQEFGLTIE
jgi:hypothetical protein